MAGRPATTTILLTNSLQISEKYVDRVSRGRLSYNPKSGVGKRARCRLWGAVDLEPVLDHGDALVLVFEHYELARLVAGVDDRRVFVMRHSGYAFRPPASGSPDRR